MSVKSEKKKSLKESKVRDYIAKNIENITEMIENYRQYSEKLEKIENEFIKIDFNNICRGANSRDILKYLIAKKLNRNICALANMMLVGKEYKLLYSGIASGKQISADILAKSKTEDIFCLFEIKLGPDSERQIITELSAYSYGLQNKFFNLSNENILWIPISIEWRKSVSSAVAFQIYFNNTSCIPLKAFIEVNDENEITSINLKCIDIIEELSEEMCLSLFSWTCFDTMAVFFEKDFVNPLSVQDFISKYFTKRGVSGFSIFVKKCDSFKNFFPFNDGFIIATFNPFKGYIKRRELEIIKKESNGDMLKVYEQVQTRIWGSIDYDLRSQEDIDVDLSCKDKDDSFEATQSYLISDMMDTGEPVVQGNFFEEFKKYFEQFYGNSIELSYPDVREFLGNTLTHVMNDIDNVSYFGLMHDAVMSRLLYDLNNREKNGDNPIIGDLSGDPFHYYSSFNYFCEFMSIMNFEEVF